jgi:4-alpha-glucanotransferase
VSAYDVRTVDGQDVIVMELVEGETLERLLARKRLPLGEALSLGIRIADALARANAAGIVHRDLKPSNVVVTAEGVKVLDLGLARLTDAPFAAEETPTLEQGASSLTRERLRASGRCRLPAASAPSGRQTAPASSSAAESWESGGRRTGGSLRSRVGNPRPPEPCRGCPGSPVAGVLRFERDRVAPSDPPTRRVSLDPLAALRPRVRQALDALGIRSLFLGIHDAAFPSRPEEDVGRGSPYSEGAADFLELVAGLGFGGVQLGPQGITSASNPSPYDGTLFSKNPLSTALLPLAGPEWGELLAPHLLADAVAGRPGPEDRVPYDYVFGVHRAASAEVHAAFQRRSMAREPRLEPIVRGLAAFRSASADWLERDALYEVLQALYGGRHWTEWTEADGRPHADQRLWDESRESRAALAARRAQLREAHASEIDAFSFAQYVLHEQHRRLRSRLAALSLELAGDLQIGLSARDTWFARRFLLPGYVMGAPPSRTNPEGQAWGYGILDPARYFEAGPDGERREGPALRFVRARVTKMFDEFDRVRIDHPHGLVCPWVYSTGAGDPQRAVRNGARLFSSPDLADHTELARLAIPRHEQIDHFLPRHDDHRVRDLDEEQVDRYGVVLEVVADVARAHGRQVSDVACEVLSTMPYPLGRVIERHGLGRFRVTQKADLERTDDVYRGENASPEDWIMLGNHDTRPIWLAAQDWLERTASRRQAEYLGWRLAIPEPDREAWAARTASQLPALVLARFADLFVGPARHVQVFFTDLLGLRQAYNRPGSVDPANWSLRVVPGFREDYASRLRRGLALDLPRALALALRSRGPSFAGAHAGLVEDLERGQNQG